jgi:hypothetical protein
MQSTLKTLLLAGAASVALAFGAASAQAGDLDDATGVILGTLASDDSSGLTDVLPTPLKDAVDAAAADAAVDTLIDALDD